jgi:hypothetical protein
MSSDYDDTTMGALTAEDMLVIGAFAPTFRSSLWLTLAQAVDELNSHPQSGQEGGLPPLLVTLCNDSRERVVRGMHHLLEELGVRALVASLEDSTLRTALGGVSNAEALLLSPNGFSSDISEFGVHADVLWYLGARYQDAALAYEPVLQSAFASIIARGVPTDMVRLVSLVGASTEDRSLASEVRQLIRIGGADADALLAEGRYRTFELREDSQSERATQLTQIASYAPDVILLFTGGSFDDTERLPRSSVVHTLENMQRSDWAPLYVFGPRNTADESLQRLAATSESFRARAIGVGWDAPFDQKIADSVAERFRSLFPEAVDPSVNFDAAYNAYDAVYLLTYALAASLRAHPNDRGAMVRTGLQQVTRAGAEVVPVGALGLDRVLELLRSNGSLDVSGTRGTANFQLETHARAAVSELYCWADGGMLAASSSVPCAEQVLWPPPP